MPLPLIEACLPSSGQILEIGCGHGLFSLLAALDGSRRQVLGVDIDDRKIAHARVAAERAGLNEDRLRFEMVAPDWSPSGEQRWDSVVILDVLYLLGAARALQLLDATAGALTPGGRLLVKEVDTTRRSRMALLTAEERVMTWLGVTRGSAVEMLPIDAIEGRLREAGLRTKRSSLPGGLHVPHSLIVGDRPPTRVIR